MGRMAVLDMHKTNQTGRDEMPPMKEDVPDRKQVVRMRALGSTNDAMVEVLSPLLPVARVLGVPLLDFDVYAESRDSDEVAEAMVPAVVSWLDHVM